MFNRIDDETKYVAVSAVNLAIMSPFALARYAKEKTKSGAKKHPVVASAIVGVVGGTALAVALIDGDQAPPTSLYAKIF